MPYDEGLAARIREHLAGTPQVTEKRMFGGLAFLVGGHMAVAASGQGGLLVRIDPESDTDALAHPQAEPMVMRGRAMEGWLRVRAEGARTDAELAAWIERGVRFTRALPPKAGR